MSTVAQHLAVMEMYRSLGRVGDDSFYNESYLLTQTHLKDMIALIPDTEMQLARAEIEQRCREQHGEKAEVWISKWKETYKEPQ